MKNLISAETAFALRDAGFPQPKKENGQVWYIEMYTVPQKRPYLLKIKPEHTYWYDLEYPETPIIGDKIEPKQIAYAPAADEILQQLGPEYRLGRTGADIVWMILYKPMLMNEWKTAASHTVASEGAAKAFIKENTRPKSVDEWIEYYEQKTKVAYSGLERKAYDGIKGPHPVAFEDIQRLCKPFEDRNVNLEMKNIALLDTGEFFRYDAAGDSPDDYKKYPHFKLVGAGWLFSCNGVVQKGDKKYQYFFRRRAMRPEDAK